MLSQRRVSVSQIDISVCLSFCLFVCFIQINLSTNNLQILFVTIKVQIPGRHVQLNSHTGVEENCSEKIFKNISVNFQLPPRLQPGPSGGHREAEVPEPPDGPAALDCKLQQV